MAFSVVSPVAAAPKPAEQSGIKRQILSKDEASIPGYDVILAQSEIPAGGREGRHTHPGLITVYVLRGELTLDCEGKPTTTYKPGDGFTVEPGKVHEGRNTGSGPITMLVTFVVKKGMPILIPAR